MFCGELGHGMRTAGLARNLFECSLGSAGAVLEHTHEHPSPWPHICLLAGLRFREV